MGSSSKKGIQFFGSALWAVLFTTLFSLNCWGNSIQEKEIYHFLEESKRLSGISLSDARENAQHALMRNKVLGNDSLEVEILLQLGTVVSTQGDKKGALKIFQDALAVSEEISFKKGICRAYLEIGYIFYSWGEYNKSLPYFQKAQVISTKEAFKDELAKAYNLLGKYYHTTGDFELSVEYYKKALSAVDEMANKDQSINFHLNLGKTYISEGNIYLALSSYLKAHNLSEASNDKLLKADVMNHLGSIYLLLKQPVKSLEYHRKALTFRKQLYDPQAMATSYNNIGETFLAMQLYDSAYSNFSQSHQLCLKTGYKKGIIKSLTNLGRVENSTNKTEIAFNHLNESYSLSLESGYDAGLVESALAIADNLIAQNRFNEAINYLTISLAKMDKATITSFKPEAFLKLYQCYKALGNLEKALEYHEKYSDAERKALLAESDHQLAELRVGFDMERKENENQLLRKENQLKQLALRQHTWVIWSTVVALLFTISLCVLIYSRYTQKRKAHVQLQSVIEELEKANIEKDKMFSIITHELRNPLFWFQNLTEMLSKNYSRMSSDKIQKSLVAIDESAKNAFHLMDNLLNWSRVRLNRITPRKSDHSLLELVEGTMCMYRSFILQKEISLEISIPQKAVVYTDADLFACILRNLVSNAIKYTFKGGTICIEASLEDKGYAISVSDSGIGISNEQLNSISDGKNFETEKGTMDEKGSGLGLKLCHEFVALNGGTIWTEKKDQGACFVFTVPFQS